MIVGVVSNMNSDATAGFVVSRYYHKDAVESTTILDINHDLISSITPVFIILL